MKTNMFVIALATVTIFSVAACSKEKQPAKATGAATSTMQQEAPSIAILAPKDGAVLESGSANKLEYNVHLSSTGNHLHIYIDDQKPVIARDVSNCPCGVDLPSLASGKHVITVKEATSAHVLTGLQQSVTVTVK